MDTSQALRDVVRARNIQKFVALLTRELWLLIGQSTGAGTSELQKVGILVSRILDISGRKSGHFHIVAANLSILGIKKYNIVNI